MSSPTPPRDTRKLHVPAPGGDGTGPSSPPRSAADRPPRSPDPSRPAGATAARSTRPGNRSAKAPTRSKTRRLLPSRPKLRRILLLSSMLLPVLLLLGALSSWLYVRAAYAKVDKIPLADVLAPADTGTTYLIVGSDSRDPQALVDAGLNPAAFEDGGGQRSDTMLLLRFVDGKATMMSIPRDLYLPIAETGHSAKINSAYSSGGPRRLVLTVQEQLGVPIQHYMEIDFVSFSKVVDALGGITIDFPHPAFDANTGLNITTPGPNHLSGPQSLEFVRSRHYVEVIDGRNHADPTGDLGRVQRQQQFLKAVFKKLGDSKNPFSLARAGSRASSGIRVDDSLGLVDALHLAWRLRSLDPTTVVLPTRNGHNGAGAVLFRVDPDADAVLAQFR